MENKVYKILVLGPTGTGKSQFCNFVLTDKTNSIFKVSDSMESCTISPSSKISKRLDINFELIDTAGSSDSSNNDLMNFKNLVEYLKEKKEIDYIIFILKFGERLTNETKEYLKALSKIFTPREFYFHLCVVFTKYPINPTKKEENQKIIFIKEINKILRDIFNIENNKIMPLTDRKVYLIDTEIIEEETESKYEQKYQDTIDIIIKQMKLDVKKYNSIKTENFEFDENNLKSRKENEKQEIELIGKKYEEEKLRREKEEKEKEKLKNELEKKENTEQEKKRKEKRLKEIMEKQEKEKEIIEKAIKEREEIIKEQKLINEEAQKKNIGIEILDKFCDLSSQGFCLTFFTGVGLGALGTILMSCCPVAAPFLITGFEILGTAGIIGGLSSSVAGLIVNEIKSKNE